MGIFSLPDTDTISIFVQFNQSVHDLMIKEASLWPNLETGGMLFGSIAEKENSLRVTVNKMHLPPDASCTRKTSYYEIEPDYAKHIVENESSLYLGNWHKHLGYGGPSSGDHRQIEDFFRNNSHIDVIMTCILDFISINDHELIIEIYRRLINDSLTNNVTFQTFRVLTDEISFFNNENHEAEVKLGIQEEKIQIIKQSLVKLYDESFSVDKVDDFPGSMKGERLISFPYYSNIRSSEQDNIIDLLILLSIPPEFPNGKLFIDLSSKDMSKTITIKKHDADVLNSEELLLPFLELLKVSLEDEIPLLLKQPLWKVLVS